MTYAFFFRGLARSAFGFGVNGSGGVPSIRRRTSSGVGAFFCCALLMVLES